MKQLGFMFMRLIGLASVLSATPTFAINYTGEALLDWSSLTFSGIAIDHAAEDTRFHGTALILDGCCSGAHFGGWPDATIVESLSEVGTVTTSAGPSGLLASVNMVGGGSAVASLSRHGEFYALEDGLLTVSIGYSLTHVGVPPLVGAFQSDAAASLSVSSDGSGIEQYIEQHLHALAGSGIYGTLSLSRIFRVGEWGAFGTGAQVSTFNPSAQSVPEPGAFWLLVGGLGVVVLMRRIRWVCQGL